MGLAAAFGLALTAEVAGQDQTPDIQYNALYNCPGSSLYNFKVLSCPTEKYCNVFFTNQSPEGGFEGEVSKSRILDAFKAGGCTVNGRPLEAAANKRRGADFGTQAEPNNAGQTGRKQADTGKVAGGRFKAGDRVKACPMQMGNCDDYWENCTVVKDYMLTEGADSYQVRCDDPRGGKGTLANVPPKFIRAGAPPEASPPACPLDEPMGAASRNAAPSPQLFKRVIYERYRDMNPGRKVGVTFSDFTLASKSPNRVVNGHLLQQGAPPGGTLYRYKITEFLLCVLNADDTISQTESHEQYFQCFKDKSGDWACAEDGRRSWDHRTIRAR